jgi:membrane-associated phospholipid phosphatase
MPVTCPKLSTSLCFAALLLLGTGGVCFAQSSLDQSPERQVAAETQTQLPDAPQPHKDSDPASAPPSKPEEITLLGTPKRILFDQKAIWTSPLHIKPWDATWLLPLSAITGTMIGSDQHTMNHLIQINANDQHHFNTISNGGIAALGAFPASMYLWSLGHDAPQAHETSLLTGEALADGYIFSKAIQFVSLRDRPAVNNANGHFWSSGPLDSSFPSDHATAAWAMASVMGDEYPGWLMRTAVYGLATGVSVSRVLAEQHFPSDVLVGSAAGWLIGHYVYRAHHNFSLNVFDTRPMPGELGTARKPASLHYPPNPLGTPLPESRPLSDDTDPDTIGSTNVPMDSWIYPALERLGAMGFIPDQSSSIRPWTRQECLRQLREAETLASQKGAYGPGLLREFNRLKTDLHAELESEPLYYESLSFESAYARFGTIAGPALQDSFHFGQTWWNDYGRPLGRGSSAVAGFSFRAHDGRLFFYDRQELQHSPGNPAESPEHNQLINELDRFAPDGDGDPMIQPIPARAAYTRQGAMELYGGVAFAGNTLSLGKQAIYWGPTTMGPLAFSSNAEPTYNLRFVATRPHPLPFMGSIGTYRFDIVLGKLSGHSYPARPWYNGQKMAFNFGDSLEISFTRWSIFWGVDHPITFHSFKDNIFSFNSTGDYMGIGSAMYGDRTDPGDRKSNFDFTWRLPFLSRLVTLYADAYSDDDPSPLAAPRRAVWNPGIYFARLPFLQHMDLRVEAVSSEGLFKDFGGQHYFINNQYLDGNTNKGFLLGNAIGRDARAIEGRTGYWFSARSRVEAGYRQNKGGTLFLPGGATVTDGFVNASYAINRHWQAQLFTQYERFLIPSYMPGSHHNTSGWLQITWNPELHLHR